MIKIDILWQLFRLVFTWAVQPPDVASTCPLSSIPQCTTCWIPFPGPLRTFPVYMYCLHHNNFDHPLYLPIVSVWVTQWFSPRSTSIHSLTPSFIGSAGHQAPPWMSWRTCKCLIKLCLQRKWKWRTYKSWSQAFLCTSALIYPSH